MIKIENVILPSAEQMEFIIQGMRNPMNSWDKSDSGICLKTLPCHSCHENRNDCKKNIDAGFVLGKNDWKLMTNLAHAGSDHRKFMRMMPVYARITAPLYWWKEFDTYKVGTVSNSCSTMHKIQEKEFTLDDFSCEHLDEFSYSLLLDIIEQLNNEREAYSKEERIEIKKDIWWQMIQLLPSSYNQTRNVMMNYETLANIYRQRKNHKLDEWREFCKQIEKLPYSELITGSQMLIKDIVIESEPVAVSKKALETIEETTEWVDHLPYDKSFIKKKEIMKGAFKMSQYDQHILSALESMATSLEKIERDLAMIQTGMITTQPVERVERPPYDKSFIKKKGVKKEDNK